MIRQLFSLTLVFLSLQMKSGLGDNPFEVFQKSAMQSNPVREAEHRVGYGSNSLQPYYICDKSDSGSAMPLSAWHYSCKQACNDDNKKTHIRLTKAKWNYIGKSVSVYKVTASKVCYTSHENVWGYCTHMQTVEPVPVTEDDRKSLPKEYFAKNSKILGVTNMINSKHAECSYISDNTVCNKDFTITYREGKLSKKAYDDIVSLNIYGDGIRTDPATGALYNNDAAWFWSTDDLTTTRDCGWTRDGETVCKLTSTSELMHCPDIGYQYNIHTLVPTSTCIGEIYDKDGPMPFLYENKQEQPVRQEILNKAKEGKGDPDINMITGINAAFEDIEETYCSASCDLFARGSHNEDPYVLDTPIGNWRLIYAEGALPRLSPCHPTATWRIKDPTIICHGKNHILVEDSNTKTTCSWDTTKDYIISDELCNADQKEIDNDADNFRYNIASNKDVSISFWTGDRLVMKPPYTVPIWEKSNLSATVSPGWFSKVGLTRGMLHNPTDVSGLLTAMVENTKQEVLYNATEGKTMRTLLADEILGGASEVWSSIWKVTKYLVSAIPKFMLLIALVICAIIAIQCAVSYHARIKLAQSAIRKSVSFVDNIVEEPSLLGNPTAPKKRYRSRASKLSNDLSFI
uniref:Glycoprotein n=1 Tax=Sambucus betanucleorhabdovirus 5 TaxID=3141833 RepID=A0AAU7E1K8_9RHAB